MGSGGTRLKSAWAHAGAVLQSISEGVRAGCDLPPSPDYQVENHAISSGPAARRLCPSACLHRHPEPVGLQIHWRNSHRLLVSHHPLHHFTRRMGPRLGEIIVWEFEGTLRGIRTECVLVTSRPSANRP